MRGADDEEAVRQALAALRAHGVAAVVVCGDIVGDGVTGADRFLPLARAWNAVFPPGCGVERLVVLGERDAAGGDVAEAWRAAFGEAYAPRAVKNIGLFRFALCREPDGALGDLPCGERPLFVVRHFPPTERDGRIPPNAIAFAGHTCAPLTDPRTVRPNCGVVTVDASSLLHVRAPGGRENALAEGLPPEAAQWRHMPDISREAGTARHAWVVCADARGATFRRLDLALGRALGDDVAVPFGTGGVAALVRREAECPAPEFPKDAEAFVEEGTGKTMAGKVERQLKVFFPAARNPSRAFDYAVTVRYAEADLVKTAVEKRVYACGLFRPEDEPAVSCVFGFDELPWNVVLDFEIVPRSAFGGRGRALHAQGYVESPEARAKRLKKERKAAAEKAVRT
ncbi:MAG: hypothetical protein IKE55_02520 [Kiritimatiellae bacterium]|nr:hypothetical protein [Kiritimatiellia bacterium]